MTVLLYGLTAVSQGDGTPTFLRLLFLTAAIIEVQMMSCDLQTTWYHGNNSDELTVLREHQLLFLTLLLALLRPVE